MVKGRAHWWDSGIKDERNAPEASLLKGVDAAFSAWTAGQCDKSLGQKVLPDEKSGRRNKVRAAKGRELSTWGKFKVFLPAKNGRPQKLRWILDGFPRGKSWMQNGKWMLIGERFPGL